MELLWWPDADRVMTRLEADDSLAPVLAAVRRTLGRLERDPFDPALRTRQFSTERYGQLRCTPARLGEWRIFWMAGPEPDQITVVFIAETML